jgi:hypothetical protein
VLCASSGVSIFPHSLSIPGTKIAVLKSVKAALKFGIIWPEKAHITEDGSRDLTNHLNPTPPLLGITIASGSMSQ